MYQPFPLNFLGQKADFVILPSVNGQGSIFNTLSYYDRRLILSIRLGHQPQPLQGAGVLGASTDEVDTGRFNGGVAQHTGQLGHVPACPVEGSGE